MRARRLEAAAWLAAVVAAPSAACGWDQLDAIASLQHADAEAEDATVEDAAATADVADDADTADTSDALPDSALKPSPECASGTASLQEWTFDTTIQGWILATNSGVKATLTWTGSTGDPTPGAMQVDFTPAPSDAGATSGVWIHEEMAAANLTGRTVSAWVWLDSGPSPQFLTFVQTATDYAWADNGVVALPLHAWTCVSLPVSAPAYNQPEYDPTNVIRIGFEMLGAKPFRVYVDSVRYD
jgi:hypothetical protein